MSEPPSEEQAPEQMTAQRWRAAVAAMPPLLKTSEAALVLRMTERTVQRLAGEGHISGASRLGKEWRFSKTDLLAQLGIRDPAEEEFREQGEAGEQ
ncbi:helix-turn-helix domain-containing protein (plasmid) [Saccharopolyspora sp. ID03-671]|uniref:helix-turn-helix domain-containing protein n=1 Tax=Saccharopolyspora sp. ID03-671 TaxID=3073066 RepID=UPI0030F40C7E